MICLVSRFLLFDPLYLCQAQLCKLPFSLFKDIGHDPHSISTQLVMRPPRLGRMILIGRTSQTGPGPQQLRPSCLKRESQPRRETFLSLLEVSVHIVGMAKDQGLDNHYAQHQADKICGSLAGECVTTTLCRRRCSFAS
jgi:hypothetical protein